MKKDTKINPSFESKCQTCLFYISEKKCAAFEEDIPEEIWNGEKEHDKPTEDQKTNLTYFNGGMVL